MASLPQNLAAEPWLSASAAITVHFCHCDVGHEQIGEDASYSMQKWDLSCVWQAKASIAMWNVLVKCNVLRCAELSSSQHNLPSLHAF